MSRRHVLGAVDAINDLRQQRGESGRASQALVELRGIVTAVAHGFHTVSIRGAGGGALYTISGARLWGDGTAEVGEAVLVTLDGSGMKWLKRTGSGSAGGETSASPMLGFLSE